MSNMREYKNIDNCAKSIQTIGRSGRRSHQLVRLCAGFALGIVLSAQSATYYVDFAGGSDSNNGTSTNTPWKHCPGDFAATANAAISLLAGDTVNFKSGVVYYDTPLTNVSDYLAYASTIVCVTAGTTNSRVVFQGDPDWGTGGYAILDGAGEQGIYTNRRAINVHNSYQTVKNFEIRNYATDGIFCYYGWDGLQLLNNKVHHIGTFPDNGSDIGTAITLNVGAQDVLVASNVFYSCAKSAFSTGCKNLTVYGNEIHDMLGHGMQPSGCSGYFLLANNYIHDNTNSAFGAHCDAAQVFPMKDSGTIIISGNRWINNADDIRFQFDSGTNQGSIYVFNNVFWSAAGGQSCSYSAMMTTAGLYWWNNTWLGKTYGGGAMTYNANNGAISNAMFLNNLYYQSSNGEPPDYGFWRSLVNGYNVWTNSAPYIKVHALDNNYFTLSAYVAAWPTNEINSLEGYVTFADYAAKDFRLAPGSAGIGGGTNLTAWASTLDWIALPSDYRPDPTKDLAANQRPQAEAWDIGACQHKVGLVVSPPSKRPPAPSGLSILGP